MSPRDDLAALRRRIEGKIVDAKVVAAAADAVVTELRGDLADLPDAGTRHYPNAELTARETEVLNRLAKGWSTKRMARELFIAEATARNHVAAIMIKTHTHTRLAAVIAAQRDGLVDNT